MLLGSHLREYWGNDNFNLWLKNLLVKENSANSRQNIFLVCLATPSEKKERKNLQAQNCKKLAQVQILDTVL